MNHHRKGRDQVLVGTDLVTLVGLQEALKEAAGSDLSGREAVVAFLMEALSSENYIPAARQDLYRTALWREYLRLRGEDFSACYSEMPVTVRGEAGEELDRFVDLVGSVFAEFELKPVVTMERVEGVGSTPGLIIQGELVAGGPLRREELKAAVSRSISGW